MKHEARKGGYVPLFEMGLEKVSKGIICIEELLKETSNIEDFTENNQTQVKDQSYVNKV